MAANRNEHIYGLDGLRAIAIIGIIFYHMFPYTVRGGFLGVSLFFVLSGFLIAYTSDKGGQDRFNVLEFYKKRIIRIYPAVVLSVFVTVGAFHFLYPKGIEGVRNEVISILLGYNNWWQIAQNSSYFTKIANATPFTHIWSLAVELQFYLIWPLIYVIYKALAKNGHKGRGAAFLLILSLISAVLMGALLPYGNDATRVYYGTDTRMYALLLGVVLGFTGIGKGLPLFRNQSVRKATLPVFCGGMVFIALSFFFVDGMADSTYTGIMQIVTIVFIILVAITAEPTLPYGRILENPVLDYIGKRSYEMYLFMYPVIFLFNVKKWTRIPGAPLIQLVVIMLLAIWEHEMTGWIVKKRLSFGRSCVKARAGIFFIATIAATVMIVFGIGTTIVSVKKNTDTDELAAQLEKNQEMLNRQNARQTAASSSTSEKNSTASSETGKNNTQKTQTGSQADGTKSADTKKKSDKNKITAQSQVPVTAIGDSVMLGASPEILKVLPKGSVVNAHESRQLTQALDIVNSYKKNNTLGDIVIIALGTNGTFRESAGQALIDAIGKERHIYWVNVYAESVQWEDDSNNTIKNICSKNDNVKLINWNSVARNHNEDRDDWFYNDDIHLKPAGQKVYAQMILKALQGDLDQLKEVK